jgi:hypothetical protein
MRRRSRRGHVVIMSTRRVPVHRQQFGRPARRRRFRLARTGALLGFIAVIRLTRITRPRWRLIAGVAGLLIEVVGFNVFSGGAQDVASVVGMTLLLAALMKDAKQCRARQVGIPAPVRLPLSLWRVSGSAVMK